MKTGRQAKVCSTGLRVFAMLAIGWTSAGAPLPALSAQFTVTPVRIFMAARDRAVAITLVNDEDAELVVEAEALSWQQDQSGKDVLEATEDIMLSPPVVRIAPRSRHVLRLARLTPAPERAQDTFRLMIREVPPEPTESDKLSLRLSITYSLPVFVTTPGAKRSMSCQPARLDASKLRIDCANTGDVYVQPRRLEVLNAAGDPVAHGEGSYVLAGAKRSFEATASAPLQDGPLRVRATLDDGTIQTYDAAP